MILIGTANNVREGKMLEAAGFHAIVAQGYEAGGHRGNFSCKPENAMLGLMAFVPQLVDAVHTPVIAAGGIMDGRGVVASLALGASAAQIGTALLTCEESGISATYKQALLSLWAGQGVGGKYQAQESVQKKISEIVQEIKDIFKTWRKQ